VSRFFCILAVSATLPVVSPDVAAQVHQQPRIESGETLLAEAGRRRRRPPRRQRAQPPPPPAPSPAEGESPQDSNEAGQADEGQGDTTDGRPGADSTPNGGDAEASAEDSSTTSAEEVEEEGGQEISGTTGSSLRRSNRIDFDERLVKGQGTRSGAVYLFKRTPRKLPELVKLRTTYRQRIIEPVLGRRTAEAPPAPPEPEPETPEGSESPESSPEATSGTESTNGRAVRRRQRRRRNTRLRRRRQRRRAGERQ
jgi:hypothetical protein